jgi:diacylglycerol kinase family enzyme
MLKDISSGYQVFVCQEEKDVTNTITRDLRERGGCGPRDVYVAVGGSGTINEVGCKPMQESIDQCHV